jgi:hypothetical protein
MKTWKIVYYPKVLNGGTRGVAIVAADTRHWAMHTFMEQYAGEYSTIDSCTQLFD